MNDPWDSKENLRDIAHCLMLVDSPEGLAELQTIQECTKARLQKAAQLLSKNQYQKILALAKINQKNNIKK